MVSPTQALSEQMDFDILAGQSVSAIQNIGNRVPLAFAVSANWTAASVSLETSFDSVTFYDVQNQDGLEVSIPVSTGNIVMLSATSLLGIGSYLRVRSGSSSTAVNQSNAATVTVQLARPLVP